MSEIGYYDTDLNESIEKVKDCIGKLNKSKPAAKASVGHKRHTNLKWRE